MKLAILIITQAGREMALKELLNSIASDKGKSEIEIFILVNGNTVPSIKNAIKDCRTKLDLLINVVESEKNLGVPGGRNILIKEVMKQGEDKHLVFIDDDAIIPKRFFNDLSDKLFLYGEYKVFTLNVYKYLNQNKLDCWPYYEKQVMSDLDFRTLNFQGGASVFHSSIFTKIGFFWGELFYAHEEFEFSIRLEKNNIPIMHLNRPHILHNHLENETSNRNHMKSYFSMRNRLLIIHRHYPRYFKLLSYMIRIGLELAKASGSLIALKLCYKGFIDFMRLKKFNSFKSDIGSQKSSLTLHEIKLLTSFLK